METILEVKGLTKHYGKFSLQDVSFALPKGTVMGFVGQNGAGKSTTIKGILGIIKPDSGTVHLFGQPCPPVPESIRDDIGVVFDELNFPPPITATQVGNVMKGIYTKWQPGVFASYCKKFKLRVDQPIQEYSRGMKMKLAIAVALSHKAKLLIMDEPTSGLDPVVREEILDELLEFIQDEECSVLLSSHITSDLEKIADYITFIQDGRLLFTGEKNELQYEHLLLKMRHADFDAMDKTGVLRYRKNSFEVEVLVNRKLYSGPVNQAQQPTIDDIILFYGKGEKI